VTAAERRIEWAVLQREERTVRVVNGPFPSREEAEAWRAALEITDRRRAHEDLVQRSAIVASGPLFVGCREVTGWVAARD
jgi:hypothetical protein